MTAQHTRLARLIDPHVREMLAHGGSDEALRMAMVNDMGPCKLWLETCTDADMDARCARYDGWYRCAILLAQVTEGIAKGYIPVPAGRATSA